MKTLFRVTCLLTLLAAPAWADRELYFNAGAATFDAAGCTRVDDTATATTYARCVATGEPDFYVNLTLPSWAPATMQIEGFEIDFMRGDSSAGDACFDVYAMVVADGDPQHGTFTFVGTKIDVTVPSGSNVKVAVSAALAADIIRSDGATACDTTPTLCRDRMLRLRIVRDNAACFDVSNGYIDITKGFVRLAQ